MKTLASLFVAGALALTAGTAIAAPAAKSAPPAKAAEAKKDDKDANQFDSWRLNCQKPEGAAAEICELVQPLVQVTGADPKNPEQMRGQLLATIGVLKLPGADKAQMVVKAPLGSLLQAPVLKVPGHKDVAFPYLVCDQSGCTTIAIGLEKEFLDAVKAAEALEVKPDDAQGALVLAMRVTRPDQAMKPEAVTVKFRVKGLTKGLDALAKKAPAPAAAPAPAKDAAKKK